MKAAIYARYSSTQQREESIEAQLRACTDYINAQPGWTLTAEYIDRAFSARSDQRPEFQRMIEDAKRKRFDVLVIHKLDRFSRDRYDHAFYKRELRQAGVQLVSVLENLDDSPESVVLEAVLEGFSEYYSKNLGREVMKGLRETALLCKHTGGIPPLGYDVGKDGKYVINEREAAAIRYIFEAYLDGVGYGQITDQLKEMGIKGKRGKTIAKNSIHDILCNEKYAGVYVFNRSAAKDAYGRRNGHENKPDDEMIRIDGGMPAIVSRETFEKARRKMSTNKSGKHRAKEPYLLSGLLFCGNCGAAFVGSGRGNPRTATETTKKYYECSTRKRTKECGMPGINRDEIENAVLSYLETLLTKETVGEITSWITANAKLYRRNAGAEIKALKKEIAETNKEANALLDKILDGMDSEIARQRLADAEARKLRLEIKLTDMQIRAETTTEVSKTQVKAYLSQLKGIRKLTREEQARVIRQFIDRIDIYDPPDGGGKEIKIKTKLDGLLSDVRTEKEAALLRHVYPRELPYWIEKIIAL